LTCKIHGYPVAIVTPKNRLLNPLVGFFMEHVRDVAASVASSSHLRRALRGSRAAWRGREGRAAGTEFGGPPRRLRQACRPSKLAEAYVSTAAPLYVSAAIPRTPPTQSPIANTAKATATSARVGPTSGLSLARHYRVSWPGQKEGPLPWGRDKTRSSRDARTRRSPSSKRSPRCSDTI